MENLQGAVEAILFASGEPVPLSRLAETLQAEKGELEKVLEALSERYNRPESGISLVRLEQSYQFCSSPQFSQEVRAALELRRNAPLSQAALEVLAVVAYHQPVTKAFVDQVRGVDCGGVLSTLMAKNLVEERGRMELPGRPLLYGTTDQFLRCMHSFLAGGAAADGNASSAERGGGTAAARFFSILITSSCA